MRGSLKLASSTSSCQYFVFKDLNELELPKTCKTEFPDVDDLLNFKLIIYPDEVKRLATFIIHILLDLNTLDYYSLF